MRKERLLSCKGHGYAPPFLFKQILEEEEARFVLPQKVQVFEYYSLSDGCRRIYTDEDALPGYGEQMILPPSDVSYYNLFINGILQPPDVYSVAKGKMFLQTEDIPIANAPIILQMITI